MQAEITLDNNVTITLPELNVISTRIRLGINGMPWHVYNKLKDLPTCVFRLVTELDVPTSMFRLTSPENRKVNVDVDVRYTFTKTDEQIKDVARKCTDLTRIEFDDLFQETPEEHRALLLALDPFFERNLLMQTRSVLSVVVPQEYIDALGTQLVEYTDNPMLTTRCIVIDTMNTKFTENAKASVLAIMRQRYSEDKRAAEIQLGHQAMLLDSLECLGTTLKSDIREDMCTGRFEITEHTRQLGEVVVKRTKAEAELKRMEEDVLSKYQHDELESVRLLYVVLK